MHATYSTNKRFATEKKPALSPRRQFFADRLYDFLCQTYSVRVGRAIYFGDRVYDALKDPGSLGWHLPSFDQAAANTALDDLYAMGLVAIELRDDGLQIVTPLRGQND